MAQPVVWLYNFPSYSKVELLSISSIALTSHSTNPGSIPAANALFLTHAGALDVGMDGYIANTSIVNNLVPWGWGPLLFSLSIILRRCGVSCIKLGVASSTGRKK